ncbi:tyrosine-protein kinase [Pseudomonas sp. G11-1]|uniref:Tyrosine-protein kinase Etk/Wzc n=1 Tax=Halopseudomonas bauzanensis TaxID=653930 RepID=A0A1I4N808_9GAMM|nr:polysaccharide biosynthesis tyrosine autokinase [Halopseudomonas bauzanensis]MCO5786150.1 tyrosine-protein kinase [Pseudomonas sp. G11-1]MCO5789376.1 tyrosine-protein kinase [Pseudomonas sp. G11-2]SES12645.1 tyrosine-protein kinase Etk/Wzc [Halopseudomonas bauzanensis]SFM11702.1 tyrosine-protein kinase Etk/Wzc [Halopseudomonas bauzanensis]
MQNITSPYRNQSSTDEIDLAVLFGALIDGKWIIAGLTLGFALLGMTYAILTTPIYQANALIQIEEKSGGLAGMSELSDVFGGPSKAVTEIELIKSRAVIGQAVTNLKLDTVAAPNYFPVFGEWAARRFQPEFAGELALPWFGLVEYAWGGEELEIFQLHVPTAYLDTPLTLVAGAHDYFSLYDGNDEQLLTGQVGQQVEQNGFRVQIARLQARPGTRFTVARNRLLNTIMYFQSELDASERAKDSGIISLSLQHADHQYAIRVLDEVSRLYVRQNVERNSAEAAQSLQFLREQLPQVRSELERYEQALNDFQMSSRSVDISIETQSVLNQIIELDTLISEQELKRTELQRRFTGEHPSYQILLEQTQQLQRQRNELSKKVDELPETQQELLRLSRDVAVTTEVYTAMLNRSQELDVLRAGTVGNVRIIDAADASVSRPVKPRKTIVTILATLFGGFLGVALVLLRQMHNRGVENPELIEQLGLPVYAAIPFSKDQEHLEKQMRSNSRAAQRDSLILALKNPADLAVESLRRLRTSLHFAHAEAMNNVLMISGPSPSVGKSFVAVNLAASMAQTGQKILLIDADMRKGYLNKVFRLPARDGLSDLLTARIDIDTAIQRTEMDNLHLMARGRIPPNPSELLMHENFRRFLREIDNRYDLIIIDTPPVLAVTDASIVGREAGISLLVTRFGQNSAKEIEAAKRCFEQDDIQLKGAIFNAVIKKSSAYGYSQYGHYFYEYKSEKA